MSGSQYPSQFKISEITIDGEDIAGMFISMEVYENIFIPLVTGNLTIMATDGNNFIEDKEIEFNEEFGFSITNGNDDKLIFKGVLNGVEGESSKENKKIYKVNFVSEEMRQNDQEFISERFKSKTPQDIIKEMIQKIGGEIDAKCAAGKPMEFIAGKD